MLCDLCNKNDACIFIEQSYNGGKRKINLCAPCAAARGVMAGSGGKMNVDSIFTEFIEKCEEKNPESKRLCPVCGRSLFDIKKFMKAGCPECYSVFDEEIKSFLKGKGIDVSWQGSLPKRLRGFRSSITDRNDLQSKLEQAVAEENYEKAAVYRDFLRALEKGCVTDGQEDKENLFFSHKDCGLDDEGGK